MMADPVLSPQDHDNTPMRHVREGMQVFDREGKKVGKVTQVFFGADDANIEEGVGSRAGLSAPAADNPTQTAGTYGANLEAAFGSGDRGPDVLRRRLERAGYIRIEGGLLSTDRFAMPDQIDHIENDRVDLRVVADQLMHG
jgi:hypothetical protein